MVLFVDLYTPEELTALVEKLSKQIVDEEKKKHLFKAFEAVMTSKDGECA